MDAACPWRSFITTILLLLVTRGQSEDFVTEEVAEVEEYCEGQSFVAECEVDEVIVMTSARYGRMRAGRCVSGDVMTGCSSDILGLFDTWCSGRHQCEVRVSSIIDSIPDDKQPCGKDFRSYLEASFTCVKAIRRPADACISEKKAEVTEAAGYLASVITDETTCGSFDIPWVLRMGSGQTIDVELYDFAVASRDNQASASTIPEVCHVYAIIKERGGQSTETICSGQTRRQSVYTSGSNILEIRLVANRKNDGYFMLRYKAKGCSDPVAPTYGWVQRQEGSALAGCNASADTWSLKCDGEKWLGEGINCTQINGLGRPVGGAIIGIFTGSQWASIVIILAIAVTLGLIIFLVGLVFLRRKRHLAERRSSGAPGRPVMTDLYSSQYRDNMTPAMHGTKPLSNMDCSSSENDYYRTWQLQRHPPGGRLGAGAHGSFGDVIDHVGLICTNPRCASQQRPYDTMDAERRYPTEHIYESPKFDRREMGSPKPPPPPQPPQNQTSNSTTASSTQYFELDPDQV